MPKAPEPTDDDLLRASREGSREAFGKLVERHQRRVAATVKSMLGDTDAAQDVGQEVFIRFFRSLDSFRGDSSLPTYLTRIAINLSLNEIKRQRRRGFFFSRDEPEQHLQTPDPSHSAESDDRQALVRQALRQLDPKFRAVVTLRLIQGYSTKETAQMLDLPEGTVLSRLARAQKKLALMLKPLI